MRLVVDTSIVFMMCSQRPFLNEFIITHNLDLIAPPWLFEELQTKAARVKECLGVSDIIFNAAIARLTSEIDVIAVDGASLLQAKNLISHASDVPFLALALKERAPIFSNDSHFKEQSVVKVYTLSELKALLMSPPQP